LEICLHVGYFRKTWENAIDEVIDADILVLSEELGETVRKKRRKHCTIAFNYIVIGMSDIPKTLRFLIYIQKLDNILTTPLGHHFQLNSNAKQARKRARGTRSLILAAE